MQRFLIGLFFSLVAFGALPNGTSWYLQSGGASTNGGGFVTGASGTNYALNLSKNATGCTNCGSTTVNLSTTDLVTAASTTIVSATANFTAAIVGNIVYITGGTGSITASRYEVITFTNSTTVVVDRATGLTTGTGATINIGGSLDSIPSMTTAMNVTQQIQQTGWIKANATYVVSGQQSIAPNCSSGTNGCSIQVNGYTTTPGDNGKATFQWSGGGTGNGLVSIDNNNSLQNAVVRNLILDCNALAGTGFAINANANVGQNIEAKNCNLGINLNGSTGNGASCYDCYAHDNPGGSSASSGGIMVGSNGNAPSQCIGCVALRNGSTGTNLGSGIIMNSGSLCLFCIAANNTAASGTHHGFNIISLNGNVIISNSVAYGNTNDGFHMGANSNYPWNIQNNISVSNGGWGFNSASTTYVSGAASTENYNFFFGNTSGAVTGVTQGTNDVCPSGCSVTSTGDPFTNGAGNVFTLNNTAGAGKAAQAAGFPGVLPGSVGTGYLDVGALQHQSLGGGTVGAAIIQ